MSDLAYRIQRKDGSYRGAGKTGSGPSKLWLAAADVVRHLKFPSSWRLPLKERIAAAGATGDEVVEYELVERRRIPVEDFIQEREK